MQGQRESPNSEDRRLSTFILVRHASFEDMHKTLAGTTPGIRLNAQGRAEAARLAVAMAETRIDAIYSSPLDRAMETAQTIADLAGLTPRLSEPFGEIPFGEWSGRTLDELSSSSAWRRFNSFRSGTPTASGQLIIEVQARVAAELDRLNREHADQRVCVVSHADVIKLALAYYAGVPIDLLHRVEIHPASVSILQLHSYGAQIRCINWREGLPDLTS
jgi:probable phosphoglycerate mutase